MYSVPRITAAGQIYLEQEIIKNAQNNIAGISLSQKLSPTRF